MRTEPLAWSAQSLNSALIVFPPISTEYSFFCISSLVTNGFQHLPLFEEILPIRPPRLIDNKTTVPRKSRGRQVRPRLHVEPYSTPVIRSASSMLGESSEEEAASGRERKLRPRTAR